MGAYMLAFLGAASGIGWQVYLTINFPTFLDLTRLTNSLEQGLIVGSVFGLGIFLTRVITERLQPSHALLRVLLGTVVGAAAMNIALFIFHVLFLNTPPSGVLITLGCTLIALTFAVSGLVSARPLKMLLCSLSLLIAILGTWLIHISLATSSVEWTPLFKYAYEWSLSQVSSAALGVALLMGIFGNMIDLSIRDE